MKKLLIIKSPRSFMRRRDRGDRARDLIDLQLIIGRADVDLSATRKTCERLFAYRKAQSWPPVVIKQDGWSDLYESLSDGLPVN